VACGHRAGRSGRPPPPGPDRARGFGRRRGLPEHRPGVGRFVAGALEPPPRPAPSGGEGGRPRPAVEGPGQPLRQGARPTTTLRVAVPVPPRTSHRHAPCILRCPISARLFDLALARPRLGASRHISAAYVALGRAMSWAAKGQRVSGPRPTPGLGGFAEAIVSALSGRVHRDGAGVFGRCARAGSWRRLVLGPPQPPAPAPSRPATVCAGFHRLGWAPRERRPRWAILGHW